MSWLLFFLLAALHPVAFIVIGFASKTWKVRLLLWTLLPLPAIWYCWDYFVIKRLHEKMCSDEGGLRVIIQPEKADRVRLIGDRFRTLDSHATLEKYFPRIQYVESKSGELGNSRDKKRDDYFGYTAVPNPRAGLPTDIGPWSKELRLTYRESRIVSPNANMYEISVHESNIPHGTSKETRLSKDGNVYAKYSEFVHWWTGIKYPDALPTWRCPEQKRSPPINDPGAPDEKWHYPPSSQYLLIELILN